MMQTPVVNLLECFDVYFSTYRLAGICRIFWKELIKNYSFLPFPNPWGEFGTKSEKKFGSMSVLIQQLNLFNWYPAFHWMDLLFFSELNNIDEILLSGCHNYSQVL